MESVDLVELPRKELKQLCNEHNIRTAGVKHDDLVRLLRNKLYPSAPDPPRLQKSGNQMSSDSRISSIGSTESAVKTSSRSGPQGRSQRSIVFADDPSQEKTAERSRRELSPSPVLPRKPVLTKSNSTPARKSDFLRKKLSNTLSGLSKQSQESLPQQSDESGKSRGDNGAQRGNTSTALKRPGERQAVKTNGAPKIQTYTDAHSEAASSSRASEADASVTARDSSDMGSMHSFGSVSEIATDAGHLAISEDSDNDDRRSVSSEPTLRFRSQINRLIPRKSAASKLGRGPWDNGHGRDSLDSSARDSDPLAAHDGEELFSYFLEDTDSLVGDTDGLDSFLDAGIADPEDIKRTDGHQVDFDQLRTPEVYSARNQENDLFDSGGRLGEEVVITHNNEVALTADHNESELGDFSLADHESEPISERAGVLSHADVPPSESEARIDIFNTQISEDGIPVEKSRVVADSDLHIPPKFPQSPDHKLGQDVGGIAEHVEEEVAITSHLGREIFNHLVQDVELPGSTPLHVTVEDPERRTHVEASHLCDSPSSPGQEKSVEASGGLSDLVHIEDQDYESRDLRVECNRVPEEDVSGVHILRNNEDLTEMLTTSIEDSEHTQGASPLLEKLDDNDVSGEHEYSQVVVTTAHADVENTNHHGSEDGTPVLDAPDSLSGDIHDIELTSADPDECSSDMKWSPVSALYEDLEDVNYAVDVDGYSLPGYKRAETGEAGSSLAEGIRPLKHLYAPVGEVANNAESAAIDAERQEGVVKKNFDSILQNETSEIALRSANGMYVTGAEATCDGQKHEGTGSQLFKVPLDLDSSRLLNVPNESHVLRVSRQNIEPVSWSRDEEEVNDSARSQDLLRSRAGDVAGTSSSGCAEGETSRCFILTQPTFEGIREGNASTSINLQTSTKEKTGTWSTCEEEGVSIRAHVFTGETESSNSTTLKEHGPRLQSSQDPQGDTLKCHAELVPEKLENTSHDNSTAATSHPRKMEKFFTVGLKMIFVIGSITLGILKFRASRLRLGEKS